MESDDVTPTTSSMVVTATATTTATAAPAHPSSPPSTATSPVSELSSKTPPTTAAAQAPDRKEDEIDETVLSLRAAGLEALAEAEQEAEREVMAQEAPSQTQTSTKETNQERQRAKDAAMSKLDKLLSQASQYTAFLEQQLEGLQPPPAPTTTTTTDKPNKKRAKKDEPPPDATVFGSYKSAPQPATLTGGTLKPYQLEGYRWLVGLWENGLNGILADEMGLGKTVQTIAFLARLRELKVFGWTVVVVPLSTVPNWVGEFRRWAPSIPVVMYHGTKEHRAELRKHMASCKDAAIPVVVTTYEIVCRDRSALQSLAWQTLVVDEGHRLKNRDCRLIKELNMLVGTKSTLDGGCSKLLLTGTPLQNNIAELWSLLHFLLPTVFNSLEFFTSVFEFDDVSADSRRVEESIVSKLHRILRPFMLRRLKSQVEKFLPPKLEMVVYCGMPAEQRDLYEAVRRGELSRLAREASNGEDRRSFMNTLMQLRKAANHPYLHFDPTAPDAATGAGAGATDASIVAVSGKLLVLDRLLDGLRRNKHKVLVFSQFTTMLDILDDYLRFCRPAWKYARLDGSTHFTMRQDLMAEFNRPESDVFCFLLSTRAGGVGINLMAADTVVLFDSDWNPHMDSQAQDRAHRIGQTRPVVVYRLISSKSVELKMLARANDKRKLERVVVRGAVKASASTSTSTSAVATASTTREQDEELTAHELRALLSDDFTGHLADVGEMPLANVDALLLDRDGLFSGKVPTKGVGYEVVEHKASSLVGEVVSS